MNGWTKFYASGSTYVGEDNLVYNGRASWRRSSFDGLIKVSLEHNHTLLSIEGPGEYWQSDDFESSPTEGSKLICRRIQRKIQPEDTFFWVVSAGYGQGTQHHVKFFAARGCGVVFPIQRGDVGKWITVEYDVSKGQWGHRITKGRL